MSSDEPLTFLVDPIVFTDYIASENPEAARLLEGDTENTTQ